MYNAHAPNLCEEKDYNAIDKYGPTKSDNMDSRETIERV